MLDKIGLDKSALKCGTHEPYSIDVARELIRQNQLPTPIQNNCSGKHAAMLALAKHLGAPTETYDQLDNPVQQMILQTVAEFSGVPIGNIVIGIDGCGVPVFGISVRAMALMYARLVNPSSEISDGLRHACQRIGQAMINFPLMIGGTKDRPGVWNFSASDGPDVRAARQSFVGNFRWPSPRMQANRSGDDQFSAHDRRDQGSSRYGIDNGRQG